jgi:hypothetical protein
MKTFRLISIAAIIGGLGLSGCGTTGDAPSAASLCTAAIATVSALQVANLSAKGQADLAIAAPLVASACPNGVPAQTAQYLETVLIPQLTVIVAEKL